MRSGRSNSTPKIVVGVLATLLIPCIIAEMMESHDKSSEPEKTTLTEQVDARTLKETKGSQSETPKLTDVGQAKTQTNSNIVSVIEKSDFKEKIEPKLRVYSRIKQKVFLSDSEKAERRDLLRDTTLFKDLSNVLSAFTYDQEIRALQSDAMDLLLESALKEKNSEAQTALLSVIENDSLSKTQDTAVQESLGGVKAEIMYKWSSGDPSVQSTIASHLPDQVSKSIWENVLDTQKRNEAESETLKNN